MTKKFTKFIALILISCLSFLIIGCGRATNSDFIIADSLFNKNIVRFDMKVSGVNRGSHPNTGGMNFSTKWSLDRIYENIKDTDGLNITKLDDKNILILRSHANGTKDHYLIKNTSEKRFRIFPMYSRMEYRDTNEFQTIRNIKFLVPFQFITSTEYLEPKTNHETTSDLNGFYDFYVNSGWYEVEKNEDNIILTGYKKGVVIDYELKGYFHNEIKFLKPIKFNFSKNSGKKYFSIEFVEPIDAVESEI